jgi:hypothetical protein
MAVEVSRHFNQAIRWTFNIEMNLTSVQRILNYTNLEAEEVSKGETKHENKVIGDLEF